MSLSGCLKKAGSALHPEDKAAIVAHARDLRKQGLSATEAGKQAAQTRIDHLRGQMVDMPGMLRPSNKPKPVVDNDSIARVQKHVDKIKSTWKNAPEVVVVNDLSDERISDEARVEAMASREKGATEGFIDTDGKVYLVAGMLPDETTIARVLVHESLGHFGLRGVFGDELTPALDRLALLNSKQVQAKAEEYGLDFADPEQRREAAEEVLASLAESQPKNGAVMQAVAAIKAWLRKHVPSLFDGRPLSDAEVIREYLSGARAYVEGGAGAYSGGSLAFSRQKQTDTPAFRKWFGDSKVVDGEGKPLRVYHGTTSNFSVFSRSRSNIESDMGAGFYFSNTAGDVASNYAGEGPDLSSKIELRAERIEQEDDFDGDHAAAVELARKEFSEHAGATMPVYLSIRNPIVLGGKDRTFLTYEQPFDEKTEEYGEEAGTLVDVLMALQGLESSFYEMNYGKLVDDIMEQAGQEGGIRANELIEIAKKSDGLMYATDDEGNLAGSEILRQAFQEAGFDGIIDNLVNTKFGSEKRLGKQMAGMVRGTVHYVAFKPEQIKSATGNIGSFDPKNPDIRFSRQKAALVGPVKAYELSQFGYAQEAQMRLQDRYNRWKQVVDDVREQGGIVNEANDFYRAEERYWGHVGARIEDFQKELDGFITQLAKDNLSVKDVQMYVYAKHAEERNKYIESKRPDMAAGSGMTTADAKTHLASVSASGMQVEFDRAAATLRGWIDETRGILLREGLISQEEHDTWANMFADYVPLRGLASRDDIQPRSGTGKGFNIRGDESKKAKGRYSEADNIIEQIIQDRTRAVIRAGKNDVGRSFGQFVLDNPDERLWKINAVEYRPVTTTDQFGNKIIEEEPKRVKDERTISFKDGGREVHILVKDVRLREQLQNLYSQQPGALVGVALMANRMMSRMYTSLSPVFVFLNAARDITAAGVGMIGETGFRGAARTIGNLPGALVQAGKAEFGHASPEFDEYRRSGGKTGFYDHKEIDDLAKDLLKRMSIAEKPGLHPLVMARHALELIEKINGAVENMTRFAAFRASKAEGKTTAQAASISKNITVNFNRKGTWQPGLSAWFLFYNPTMQGSARIVQALRDPKTLATLGFAMAGVAALAMRNADMGDDDDGVAWWDKIPDETKERNLIIMLPPGSKSGEGVPGSKIGRYVKIPMPYGYNVFAVIANQSIDVLRHQQDPKRGRSVTEAMGKTLNAFLGSFLPSNEAARGIGDGSLKSLAVAATPNVLHPLAQIASNTNSFGRTLYPDDRQSQNLPDSAKFFPAQAGTIFQKSAEKLNSLTGGDKKTSGMLDVTPATLELLAHTFGGGPVQFALDLTNAMYVRQEIKRPDLDVRRLPFIKQGYGIIDAETDRLTGYDRLDKISKVSDRFDSARREGLGEIAERIAKEEGDIAQMGGLVRSTRGQLANIRREELRIISSDKSDAEKFMRMQQMDERKRLVFHNLNRAFDQAVTRKAMQDKQRVPATAE